MRKVIVIILSSLLSGCDDLYSLTCEKDGATFEVTGVQNLFGPFDNGTYHWTNAEGERVIYSPMPGSQCIIRSHEAAK